MNAISDVRSQQAEPVALKFEIGARTLMAVRRVLVRVPIPLAGARDAALPGLPPLPDGAEGYAVTSLPEAQLPAIVAASGGMLPCVRQRYTRYYTDLSIGFEAWFAGLSGNARSQLKRKAKKIASETGGTLDVRRFTSPDELDAFHDVARRISLRTYQERLLGSGLPDDPAFFAAMHALAAAGQVRAWLLYIAAEPAAYLYCPIDGDTVIYAHVGHDPAFNDRSPGAVLQLVAMQDLFDEGRFATFDFTEGEGQHKRQFATGGAACLDLLLLRPTLANRAIMVALAGFDSAVATAKKAVTRLGLARLAKRVRRG